MDLGDGFRGWIWGEGELMQSNGDAIARLGFILDDGDLKLLEIRCRAPEAGGELRDELTNAGAEGFLSLGRGCAFRFDLATYRFRVVPNGD